MENRNVPSAPRTAFGEVSRTLLLIAALLVLFVVAGYLFVSIL